MPKKKLSKEPKIKHFNFKYLNKGISTPVALGVVVISAILLALLFLGYQYYTAPREEEEINIEEITPEIQPSEFEMQTLGTSE